MSKNLSRRKFIGASASAVVGLAALGWVYQAKKKTPLPEQLIADPIGILDLPEGFSYRILQRTGDLMSDGFLAPSAPDGMACFAHGDSEWVLMRTHEIDEGVPANRTLGFSSTHAGGVTRLVLDRSDATVKSTNFILTGTSRNCSGGASPYGWLSCEETEEDGHGYVFLCDPFASSLKAPHQLSSLGRFSHEAAAFDPATGVTYLTEDKNKGAIYRHVPDAQHSPFAEGDLQALKVRDIAEFDLSSGKVLGDHFDVEWVPIDDPSATTMPTRKQAKALGAARFSRGEGAFFAGGSAYFCSTNGGPTERGQVYRLDIGVSGQNDRLTLIAQADKEDALDRPDNITVAPWGDVFVAEDGKSPNGIFLIRPDGKAIQVARNAVNSGDSEVTGICFSPDGKWLFLNIQWEGLTVAVTGPFENLSTAV